MSQQLTIELDGGVLCRALTSDGNVRIVGVRAQEACSELHDAHGLEGDAAAIASEGLVATALMSAHIKGQERMTIQIQSSMPLLSFFAEISSDGGVRGRLRPAFVSAPDCKLTGVLLAIKSNEEQELYRGATTVDDQTLTDALRGHFADSVQIDGLLWTGGGAGVLLERLPSTDGSHGLSLEEFHSRYGRLQDGPASDVVDRLLAGKLGADQVTLLEIRSVAWQCRCSQERVLGMIATLDADTVREMIEEDAGAEVICHFCNHPYTIGVEQLERQLASRAGQATT